MRYHKATFYMMFLNLKLKILKKYTIWKVSLEVQLILATSFLLIEKALQIEGCAAFKQKQL